MAAGMVEHHSQSAVSPGCHSLDWGSIDSILHSRLSLLRSELISDAITVVEAGHTFSSIVSSLLSTCSAVHNKRSSGPHRPRATDKQLSAITKKKNSVWKDFRKDPSGFLNAVHAHNKFLCTSRQSYHRSAVKQERAF
uniref:Uncharacterized protein n=1 Tax=Amphimedon queenslandica TaxID=400682 RepID=A0A1X7UZW8_AMPQE